MKPAKKMPPAEVFTTIEKSIPVRFVLARSKMVPVVVAGAEASRFRGEAKDRGSGWQSEGKIKKHTMKTNIMRNAVANLSMPLLLLTGLCLLGGAGCVSYPIAKPFREQAQATKNVSFLTIWRNPHTYVGSMVIWGGRILKTVNNTNDEFITVLQAPLDDQERPLSTKLSQGRFVVRSSDFLDPEVYRTGAKITIAGVLTGSETQKVGQRSYAFPLVTLRDVYFWRPESILPPPTVYVAPPAWDWGWPYQPYYGYGDDGDYAPGYYNLNLDLDWGRRYDRSRRGHAEGKHERR